MKMNDAHCESSLIHGKDVERVHLTLARSDRQTHQRIYFYSVLVNID